MQPAWQTGRLRVGDVIVSADGIPLAGLPLRRHETASQRIGSLTNLRNFFQSSRCPQIWTEHHFSHRLPSGVNGQRYCGYRPKDLHRPKLQSCRRAGRWRLRHPRQRQHQQRAPPLQLWRILRDADEGEREPRVHPQPVGLCTISGGRNKTKALRQSSGTLFIRLIIFKSL